MAGVPVSVASVSILPFSGKGRIKGLKIGNPPGFSQPYAVKVSDVRVRIDLKSLGTDRILVREIYVRGPEVDYETGSKGSNLEHLRQNAESFAGPSSSPVKSGPKNEKKVIIERFVVKDGKVSVGTHLLKGKSLSAALPDLELKDIGKESGGASIKEAASQIFGSISGASGRAASGLGNLGKAAEKGIESVGRGLRSLFK